MFFPSVILSLVAASTIWLLGRKNPARNPRITGAILLILLLLPFFNLLPKHEIEVATSSQIPRMTWSVLGIWIAGLLFFSIRGMADLMAMKRWKKESHRISSPLLKQAQEELQLTNQVELRSHPDLSSPVVSGLLKPTIYLPKGAERWPEKTLKMALLHELGHIQRHDLWLAAAARCTCIFHWFNPMVWWLRKALLSQCEYACDAHLMRRGTDRKTYAHALCDVAENTSRPSPALTIAMAGHVPLRERIMQLSDEKNSPSIILAILLALTTGSAIAMSVVGFVPKEIPFVDPEVQLRITANPFPLD